MTHTELKSTFGTWKVLHHGGLLHRLELPARPVSERAFAFEGGVPSDLKPLADFLRQYFLGKRCSAKPRLFGISGTNFQQVVWKHLLKLSFGRTISYQALGERVGRPGSARAVGNACGSNPLPILIPCHRVVASSGGLGGFSGGLAWKKWLLNFEQRGCKKERLENEQQR